MPGLRIEIDAAHAGVERDLFGRERRIRIDLIDRIDIRARAVAAAGALREQEVAAGRGEAEARIEHRTRAAA